MRRNNLIFGSGIELFLGIALILGMLLPHKSIALMLVNPFLCATFIFCRKNHFPKFSMAFICAIFISILLNLGGEAKGKSLLMAFSIIICMLAFPMVRKVKVKNIYIYTCFCAIFLSQIAYMYHLEFITSLIDTYYPITWAEDLILRTNDDVTTLNFLDFRLGGLYRNPNQCAKYVSFILAIYIVNNKERSLAKQVWFILLCFFSIVLTGSRTGFVICCILILLYVLKNQHLKNKYFKYSLLLLVFILILYNLISEGSGRGTKIEEGLGNSAGLKFNMLIDYLSQENSFLNLLFGHIDHTLFTATYYTDYSLDCEYGYIIYCFGFVGFFAFAYYLYQLYKHLDNNQRIFFVVILWMITSSIYMAYRSVFVFTLLLSTIYNEKRRDKKYYKNNFITTIKQ